MIRTTQRWTMRRGILEAQNKEHKKYYSMLIKIAFNPLFRSLSVLVRSWPGFAFLGFVEYEKVQKAQHPGADTSQMKCILLLIAAGLVLEKAVSYGSQQVKNTDNTKIVAALTEFQKNVCKSGHGNLFVVTPSVLDSAEDPDAKRYEIVECFGSTRLNITACFLRSLRALSSKIGEHLSNRRILAGMLEHAADFLEMLQQNFPWVFQLFGGYVIAVAAVLLNQVVDTRKVGLKPLASCFLFMLLKQALMAKTLF
ncbi:hypothetical protein CDAR_493441 [Caerostris darwini]|uniref:Uncharacterized protein n=1 Tax=Caerostris darwini TaxID=1538125 RepID=A0AAV4QD74_9ARAC|nr:hypothetical protein CDAR_493441 [Caerostris darwini]